MEKGQAFGNNVAQEMEKLGGAKSGRDAIG